MTIVSPDFLNASSVWADTLLTVDSLHSADRFALILDEGVYQWSLSAANGVYQSKESVFTLIFDPRQTSEPELDDIEDLGESTEQ